jgi:hypothetical protein
VRLLDLGVLRRHLPTVLVGALVAPFATYPIAIEPDQPVSGYSSAIRKGPKATEEVPPAESLPTLGTLVSLREHELVVLSETEPSQEQFSTLLRDRVTGESVDMAPRLLELVRELAQEQKVSRVEFISGYRSWKLNEMLRKKGRNVASQSQHCQGTAMDFRVEGMSAKDLAGAIEALRWKGGLAHYPGDTDRFVHADVGPHRRWRGR